MSDTRARLLGAAADLVRERGVAAASARAVAARADVNQALVFYHFGTLVELLDAACRAAVEDAVAAYRADLDAATSLADLVALGHRLREAERGTGNVAMMAQLLAAAPTHPTLAASARHALDTWTAALEPAVARSLAAGPLAGVLDPADLTSAVVSAFVGVELVDSVHPTAAGDALAVLDTLAALVRAAEDLGPVAGRAVGAVLRARASRPALERRDYS